MTPRLPDALRITVTPADVLAGITADCRKCPAALALQRRLDRLFPDELQVEVDWSASWVRHYRPDPSRSWVRYYRPVLGTYSHSPALEDQIRNFDVGKEFKPGRYTLRWRPEQ